MTEVQCGMKRKDLTTDSDRLERSREHLNRQLFMNRVTKDAVRRRFQQRLIPGIIAKLGSRMFDAGLYFLIDANGPLYPSIRFGRTACKDELLEKKYEHQLMFFQDSDQSIAAAIDEEPPEQISGPEGIKSIDAIVNRLAGKIPELAKKQSDRDGVKSRGSYSRS